MFSGYDKIKASTMALVVQTQEHLILMSIDSGLASFNRSADVLIFDGCLVRKEPNETQLDRSIIDKIEEYVLENTNYRIRLECKPMVSSFVFDKNIINVDKINDDIAAEHLYQSIKGKIVKTRDDYWVFDDTTGVWTDEHDVLKKLIHKNSQKLVFNVYDANNNSTIHDYGGMVYNMERMIKQVSNFCPKDKKLVEKNIDSSVEKLIFSDGIYNFKTDSFVSGFNPQIFSLYHIEKPFQHERDEQAVDIVHKLLFEDPFLDEDADVVHELKKHIAASIAGKYRSKKFRIIVGSLGDSGKGTLCDALAATFGDYVKSFNGANLFDKSNINTDDEKKGSWKLDLNYKRMVFSNEISMNGYLDGNAIKSVSSGGDEYDARKNHRDPISARFRCQLWMMLNDVPKIKPYDAALDRRMTCFEYKIQFKPIPDPKDPLQKKQDENIKEMFENVKYQYALLDILRDAYQVYLQEGFIEIEKLQEYKKEWLQSDNALLYNLSKAYEITYDEKDFTPYKEIEDYILHNCKMQISEKKLPRELTALGLKSNKKKIDGKTVQIRSGIISIL